MYCIIGTREDVYQRSYDEGFISDFHEEVIATFDVEFDAKAYIENSRLASAQRNTYSSDQVFRRNSLLSNCVSARVDVYVEATYPHNPWS